ncbi:MAG: hypothetical protein A3G24_18975 [Betaproteobacteria bacterium RIFCSPLOWO2_12_FULL_62_13]|nr:MAG: hypothetical protein A3G24_18975 [Betaproteobacteria bacterium RIFCSPLOWO2_12_FULL_62_13]
MREVVSFLVLALCAFAAHAQIYECVEPNGIKRFTNIQSEAKGCKLLDIGPINTVPAPKPQAKKSAPGPVNFPKVDPQTQRQRDADRRRILEQELANEQKLLDQAQKELAGQESIRLGSERNYQRVLDRLEPYKKKVKLHEDNVTNLKKELANLR